MRSWVLGHERHVYPSIEPNNSKNMAAYYPCHLRIRTLHIHTWYQQDGYCKSRDKSKSDLHIQKTQSQSYLQWQAETVIKLEWFKKQLQKIKAQISSEFRF